MIPAIFVDMVIANKDDEKSEMTGEDLCTPRGAVKDPDFG
jgi:hypothetical protein